MDYLKKAIFLLLIIILISGCLKESPLTTGPNTNETSSREGLEITDLSAQQLILGENETRVMLGSDWKKVYQATNKNPSINATSEIFVTYEKGLVNETEVGGDKSFFDSHLLVFPDINETRKFYIYYTSEIDQEIINKPEYSDKILNESELSVGDEGKIYADEDNIIVIFRKNNVASNMVFHNGLNYSEQKIDFGEKDVNSSTAIEIAGIQEAKIKKFLDLMNSGPTLQWINVLDNEGRQEYAYRPGQTANFKIEALDTEGFENMAEVNISIFDPHGNLVLKDITHPGDIINPVERNYDYQFTFPSNAILGIWKTKIIVTDKEGQTYSETAILRLRKNYTSAPQKMTLGALEDYGFKNYRNYNKTIEDYSKYKGLEIWKLGISWDLLEPEEGKFNEEYIDAILKFMDAAGKNGAKVQIGIAQQWWPAWANNGKWDNRKRYEYETTKHLSNTWMNLSRRLKDHPALDSYLIINEENFVYDADIYLRALNKIASSIRSVDGNMTHRITIRPNSYNSYNRSRIAQDGIQDYDYGTGVYPTGWAWFLKNYENPISDTSYLRMSLLRSSPLVYGGPGGVGEIGFFSTPNSTFGDNEKLLAFERAMSIAYDQGMDEFMIWGTGFSFKNPEIYFPKLKEFRDELIKQQRPERFIIRILIDNKDWFYNQGNLPVSKLDMNKQPYYHMVKTLDERGYSWFYTSSNAESIQIINFNTTIKLSEIKGKSMQEQDKIISERLKNITPSGKQYPWPEDG